MCKGALKRGKKEEKARKELWGGREENARGSGGEQDGREPVRKEGGKVRPRGTGQSSSGKPAAAEADQQLGVPPRTPGSPGRPAPPPPAARGFPAGLREPA